MMGHPATVRPVILCAVCRAAIPHYIDNRYKHHFCSRKCSLSAAGCRIKFPNRAAANYKHGKSHTPEYRAWQAMMNRCFDSAHHSYARYGGRGITICERWMQFLNFYADMGLKPTPLHSLGRISNSGNYEPGNVAWQTQEEQQNNRSDNRNLEFNGRVQTMEQWAREVGISSGVLYLRIVKLGWPVAQAFAVPVKSGPHIGIPWLLTFRGQTKSVSGWSRVVGIHKDTILYRLNRLHWSIERSLTEPVNESRRRRAA
jgi:hypothetical protein